MREGTISEKGELPALTREELQALGVKPGERVVIDVNNGVVTITPLMYLDDPKAKR